LLGVVALAASGSAFAFQVAEGAATPVQEILTGGPKAFPEAHLPEPLIQEFPLAEHLRTQEKSEFQVTMGSSYVAGKEETTSELRLQMEYGITYRWQAAMEIPYVRLSSAGGDWSGISDAEASLKYAILRTRRVSLAAAMAVAMEKSLEDGDPRRLTRFEPSGFIATHLRNAYLQMHVSPSWGDGSEVECTLSAAYPWDLWRGTFEVRRTMAADDAGTLVVPGLVRQFRGTEFAVGAPVGISGPTTWGLMVKLTHEFRGKSE
jgi:hypothetical protein